MMMSDERCFFSLSFGCSAATDGGWRMAEPITDDDGSQHIYIRLRVTRSSTEPTEPTEPTKPKPTNLYIFHVDHENDLE